LEELVCFSAAQSGLHAGLIELYRKRQPKISEHQQTIAGYLRLHPFDDLRWQGRLSRAAPNNK
jgi:hypothetical protein